MSKITISIDLESGSVDVQNNNSSHTGKKTEAAKLFRCESKYLALKILDAGLIDNLYGVEYDEKLRRRVYIFLEDQDVKDVYLKYFENAKAEKIKRFSERKAKNAETEKANNDADNQKL